MHATPKPAGRRLLAVAAALVLGITAIALALSEPGAPPSSSTAPKDGVPHLTAAGPSPPPTRLSASVTGGLAPPTPGQATPACGAWGCEQERRFADAARLVASKPGYLGIVVRDRRTGAVWRTGTSGRPVWASSTPKLAMAASLLERARSGQVALDATARRQIAAMLSVSDDDAADALWDRYAGEAMVPHFRQAYGMAGIAFVTGFPRRWGFLKCSAEDLRRLMSYLLDELHPADRDYLMAAMRSVGPIQRWGVWAAGADRLPGTKNGWSIESDPGGRHWCTSTVGFAGPGARYVVSAMYHLPPAGGVDAGVHAVSDLVATVFGTPTPAAVTVPDPGTGR